MVDSAMLSLRDLLFGGRVSAEGTSAGQIRVWQTGASIRTNLTFG